MDGNGNMEGGNFRHSFKFLIYGTRVEKLSKNKHILKRK
jgi:hypothetical protein